MEQCLEECLWESELKRTQYPNWEDMRNVGTQKHSHMLQRETFDNRRLSDSDIDEVSLVVDEMIRDGGAYGFPDTSDPLGSAGEVPREKGPLAAVELHDEKT